MRIDILTSLQVNTKYKKCLHMNVLICKWWCRPMFAWVSVIVIRTLEPFGKARIPDAYEGQRAETNVPTDCERVCSDSFFFLFSFSLFSLLLFFSIWWRVSAQFIRTSVSSATFSFSIHNSPATPPRQQKKKRTWMALVIKDFALKRTVRHQKRLDSRENVALYFGITTISFPVNARSIWSMPWEVGETW